MLQVKTNFTTSAKITKTILLIEKYFAKTAQKNACTLIKLAQKTQPATAKNFLECNGKNSPVVRENRPTGNTAQFGNHSRIISQQCFLRFVMGRLHVSLTSRVRNAHNPQSTFTVIKLPRNGNSKAKKHSV